MHCVRRPHRNQVSELPGDLEQARVCARVGSSGYSDLVHDLPDDGADRFRKHSQGWEKPQRADRHACR